MDKKKTLNLSFLILSLILLLTPAIAAQTPSRLQFCDRAYEYGIGNDSVKLFFNVYGENGKTLPDIPSSEFSQFLNLFEDGDRVPEFKVRHLNSGIRLPKDYTFSILMDQSIPSEGKQQILKAVKEFIEIAPDSCIYVSFYGDEVSKTIMATSKNFTEIERAFLTGTEGKAFYSGVYSKLAEFAEGGVDLTTIRATDYRQNPAISSRARKNPGKNILMVFAEGSNRPEDEILDILSVEDLQAASAASLPKVYAFYYTAEGEDAYIENTLKLLANPKDANDTPIAGLKGKVKSSANMEDVLNSFAETIEESAYGYELSYRSGEEKTYTGNVSFKAEWGKTLIGEGTMTIGSAERPWPEREQSTTNIFVELLVAILVTIVTFGFFYLIMRIVVPYIRFLSFKSKYYKKYQPEENVQRRICHYCKQDLRPGEVIVTKCKHWMHKHCWEQNGYKCSEYGQNCKTGIQDHIEWKEMFKKNSLKECSQTIAGVLAGLISWIIYEICGRGGFSGLSEFIVGLVLKETDAQASLIQDCVMRTSSFLMIGLLLGFFISLVFRYKDDIRDKNWKIWLKIIGLSIMTGAIGMLAFAVGADLFCLILSWTGKTYIPWYCSLPAYILFSISVSLALTIKSTIPVKSALIGGTVSAFIGFLVLYFTKFTSGRYEWLNMLLDFIIYGGGLGASLVTVRMLAEKYFLVIQNGVKAGLRIPIHKWMNATGGGNKVSIGMTGECEIQMNWEKSNKVAKEHAQLFIDHEKNLPVVKPLAPGVLYNTRAELPVNRAAILSNGDTFKIGDTIFKYEEA
ncbi:MAG: hypothetical protein K2G23_07215 [Muribaculaceae bacterium]|nr:hypothetical protein [Muribaculaceae bacterium]